MPLHDDGSKTAICAECGVYKRCTAVWDEDGQSFDWMCNDCIEDQPDDPADKE